MQRPFRPSAAFFVPLLASAVLAGVLASPAFGAASILEAHEGLEDLDLRPGAVAPTSAQVTIVDSLGADATWNQFGTPSSLISYSGDLGPAPGEPAAAARAWLNSHRDLFRLSATEVADLEVLNATPLIDTDAVPVLFRQRFGDLDAAVDGTVTVLVDEGRVLYVSSGVAGSQGLPPEPTVDVTQAWLTAATDAGLKPDGVVVGGREQGWTLIDAGLSEPGRARLVAVPQPTGGVRSAFETLVIHNADDGHSVGHQTYVDAVSGEILVRVNIVDQLSDNPRWKYFPANPPIDFSSRDTRILGCWQSVLNGESVKGCDLELKNDAAHVEWDVDPSTTQPTFTTKGNSANTALSSLSPFTPSDNYRPVSPDREYIYPWTNYWYEEKCPRQNFSPDMTKNDINAAIVNLFVQHNRIHDWSYELGFTEPNYNLQQVNFRQGGRPGDPETGNAMAGFVTGGSPTYTGRDNANQITPNDGISPITNMYLWQPIAGAFYPPCVDGDYDMSVIVHEYTHAISNRMVGGPDAGIGTRQGGSMGESWSDLAAVEYLYEYGYAPVGNENPYAVGPYVTGNLKRGIRNYAMNKSPLNYSDVGYDLVGAQVHADGEIWSATNFDMRKALMKKYSGRFPAGNQALQRSCADGKTPVEKCPGNHRWMQIVFDAWLLMPSSVSMVEARDAYLAADKARFDGANQKALWKAFAQRGFGKGATEGRRLDANTNTSPTAPDDVVKASFKSPKHGNEGTLKFVARDGRKRIKARIYVGRYEARVTPIADTIAKTKKRKNSAQFVPGRYDFVAQAKGYGMLRFKARVRPNRSQRLVLKLEKNWASAKNGAKAKGSATSAGPIRALIDDTEQTNWTVSHQGARGAQATVNLAGGAHVIRRIKVSAMLRPRNLVAGAGDPQDVTQNRFSALRSYEVLYCRSKCGDAKNFKLLYKSRANAFPARSPRPLATDLILRGVTVPRVRATHLRFVVLSNQCTGQKSYHGEQDSDPTNDTDCREGSSQDDIVRTAEFQAFSRESRVVRR